MPRQPDQLGGEVLPDGADQLEREAPELAAGQASKMTAPAANAEADYGQSQNTPGTTLTAADSHPAAADDTAAAAGTGLNDSELFMSTRFTLPASSNSSEGFSEGSKCCRCGGAPMSLALA